ncbi:hypothetical protein [Micropruina glycogenica]
MSTSGRPSALERQATMLTAHATGDWSGPVREEFLTIMCSDPVLLGYAFDTIMTEQYGNQNPNATEGDPTQTPLQRSDK